MTFGIQVYDPNGNIIVDTSDRVFTILGYFSASVGPGTTEGSYRYTRGTITNSAFSRGIPGYVITRYPIVEQEINADCFINFSGNDLQWTVRSTVFGHSGIFAFTYGYL